MKQNKAQPTLSLSLSAESRFQRNLGVPTAADGVAPTITASYAITSAVNMISTKHYPKMGVAAIYETK